MKTKILIGLVVLLSIALIFLVVTGNDNRKIEAASDSDKESTEETVYKEDLGPRVEEKKFEELTTFISSNHDALNELTGSDEKQTIDWSEFESVRKSIIEEIPQLLEMDHPEDMTVDLERLIDLANIALENQDETAVIYMHRILHDLDIEYNGYEHTSYGVTNYWNGGLEQITIEGYIFTEKQKQKRK